MNTDPSNLTALMAEAVEASIRHVQAGGIPFVGVLITTDGWVADPGVNLVRETGDPTAHAEIVALRQATEARGASAPAGGTLLATGEPCALCYRAADTGGVAAVYYAVDADTVAAWGFDYRAAYTTDRTEELPLATAARHLPVDRALEPFVTYQRLHTTGAGRRR